VVLYKKDRVEITSCKRRGGNSKHGMRRLEEMLVRRKGGRGRGIKSNMDDPCPSMHIFTPF
jgi:hypothetical protein